VCFRHDCPRAARIRELQADAEKKARELLGDPRKGVTFPTE
jgi:hypothetical protein